MITPKNNIIPKLVKELFDYRDNDLYWKVRPAGGVDINKPAGFVRKLDGYRHITISDSKYFAHRLIWVWYYGVWPQSAVDHIDNNKSNNSVDNLRLATHSQNQCNAFKPKNNTSGVKGVSKAGNKWKAEIMIDKKSLYLGTFNYIEEAAAALTEVRKKYHGEFANHG
jgi:hypothetical protein